MRLLLTLLLAAAPLALPSSAADPVPSPLMAEGKGAGEGGDGGVSRIKLGDNATLETSLSPAQVLTNFFLLPLAYAFAMPHGGFERYPYETDLGYGRGEREVAASLRGSRQSVTGGRQAQHTHLRVRGGNRLGWDLGHSSYDPKVYSPSRRAGLWAGHVTANYVQTGTALLELGIGAASFQDPRARAGLSMELAADLFPARPWTLALRWQGAALHGRGFHDLSAHAGATWRRFALGVGYRAFLNPIKDISGPEAVISLWF